jgi:hypothetical protein
MNNKLVGLNLRSKKVKEQDSRTEVSELKLILNKNLISA